jgi:hypothetical protein
MKWVGTLAVAATFNFGCSKMLWGEGSREAQIMEIRSCWIQVRNARNKP